MRLAAIALTTAALGCAVLYKIARAQLSRNGRTTACPDKSRRERGVLGLSLIDPDYRREWFAELCNVYRRMEILRQRRLLRHGIFLTSGAERSLIGDHQARQFQRARIRSIQALRTIHPGATVTDHYLASTLIGPDLFAEDWDTEAVSVRGRIGTC